MTLIATSDYRSQPSQEYRFFLYDPMGDGMMFFRSAEVRDAIAKRVIGDYLDDTWSDEVNQVCAGEVTAETRPIDVRHKPERKDFDNDAAFEAALDDWPGTDDHDTICDYELRPLAAPK